VTTVARVEVGMVSPRWDTVLKLAKGLDVPVSTLDSSSDEDNEEPTPQPASAS
jgi:hypothetical protein